MCVDYGALGLGVPFADALDTSSDSEELIIPADKDIIGALEAKGA
jgi:hypothetical protein